jgi:hypothetical protein
MVVFLSIVVEVCPLQLATCEKLAYPTNTYSKKLQHFRNVLPFSLDPRHVLTLTPRSDSISEFTTSETTYRLKGTWKSCGCTCAELCLLLFETPQLFAVSEQISGYCFSEVRLIYTVSEPVTGYSLQFLSLYLATV